MNIAPGASKSNGYPSGNPKVWLFEGANESRPFEMAVGALLAVPKCEADAEEAKRHKRSAKYGPK